MSSVDGPLWTQTEDGEMHIVSKCGLYCDTCPAFQNGLCNGCPRLEIDDCVVRDCAHRKNLASCHDCELDSCYHFEAYAIRRALMRERTKAYMKLVGSSEKGTGGCGSGSCGGACGAGGCGSGASGGCSGCSSSNGAGGCAAIKMIEALAKIE